MNDSSDDDDGSDYPKRFNTRGIDPSYLLEEERSLVIGEDVADGLKMIRKIVKYILMILKIMVLMIVLFQEDTNTATKMMCISLIETIVLQKLLNLIALSQLLTQQRDS